MRQRYNFGYLFSEGFHSIFTHGFMSFAAVCMIVCCLLIMGSFSLVAVNAQHNFSDLEKDNQFSAYIDETLTQEEARALQDEIEAIPNVARADFVTKEEAQADFEADYEGNPLFEGLPSTVYRDRYHIYLKDLSKLTETEAAVKQVAGVAAGEPVHHLQHHQAGHLQPAGGDRHHEDVRRHQLLCPLALRL